MTDILTAEQVRAMFRISRWTLARWVNRDTNPLPCFWPGGEHGKPMFYASEVHAWTERCRQKSAKKDAEKDAGEILKYIKRQA